MNGTWCCYGCEAHWEVVGRILFIYAKLNPGIAYVQGMNEIVGPLYYTFATDPNSEWRGKQVGSGRSRSLLLPPGESGPGRWTDGLYQALVPSTHPKAGSHSLPDKGVSLNHV